MGYTEKQANDTEKDDFKTCRPSIEYITMYRRIHQVSIQRLAMRWTPTGKRNRGRPTETWTRLGIKETTGHALNKL